MRRITFFSGNRAEFGLQRPIIEEAMKHQDLDVSILISGAHLDPFFGKTIQEVVDTGIKVSGTIDIPDISRDIRYTSLSIAKVIEGISNFLLASQPSIFVVYADRFEGFAALVASTQMNIPTAHIEGGDLTEGGALDDSIRHAMTKLAHLHFVTNDDSMKRVLNLGEESWRVHNVGFPAIDLIQQNRFASRDEIVQQLGIDLEKPLVVFTQHSITIEPEKAREQMQECVNAIRCLMKIGVQVIVTYPNNDDGSHEIIEEIEKLKHEEHELLLVYKSLGRHLYHGLLALARDNRLKVVCAGNSSSGIKETPAFGCPTVNIGNRQASRLRGKNVIDTVCESKEIIDSIKTALFDENFREMCRNTPNPYFQGGASQKVVEVLRSIPLDKNLLRKKMTY